MKLEHRMDILRNHVVIGEASTTKCNVKFDSTSLVQRGINFSADLSSIAWNSPGISLDLFQDRFQPVLIIDGAEYPLGIYMVIAAPKTITDRQNLYEIEAYDETMLLKQACLTSRTLFPAGTKYLAAVENLLVQSGLSDIISDNSSAVLTTDREFAVGETYLDTINTLLEEINYNSVWAGIDGAIHLSKKENLIKPDFIYRDGDFNLIGSVKETTDIYDLPNILIGVASNPDTKTEMYYKRVNDDPGSQISTVKRGYSVVKKFELKSCPDEATLKNYIDQKYLESCQTTETLTIETPLQGGHLFGNMIQLQTRQIEGLYLETSWEMDLETGGTMKHTLERKLFV